MHCKSILAVAAMSALIGLPQASTAAEAEIATYQLDGEVKLLTDERTRGISDSLRDPALKLSLQFAHESGIVAVAELVSVSRKQFLGGSGVGVTLGGGYRFGEPEAWHFGLGLATELFPGAKFNAPHALDLEAGMPIDFRDTNYNSSFAVLEIGYGAIEGRILNVISKTYRGGDTGGVCGTLLQFAPDPMNPAAALDCYARGDHGTRGTLLFDLGYTFKITPATQLALHVGRQVVANFPEANFTDYRIGLTHKQWGFEWSAEWMATRNKVREL